MSIDNFNIEHRLSCLVICLGHTCSLVGYLQRTSSVLDTVWPQWCQCEQGSVLHQKLRVEAEKDTEVKSCTGAQGGLETEVQKKQVHLIGS